MRIGTMIDFYQTTAAVMMILVAIAVCYIAYWLSTIGTEYETEP